ncbi:MAG TPA: hypothetical protein VKU87_03480, partial [Thermomicrobiaceae bacterium]|nr:hypothetical protein [Thermomicrobiaceae bacterium]
MRLRNAILSGLMILSMLGVGALQVVPVSADSGQTTQSTTTSVSSQSSSVSNLNTQLNQQGVGFSALLNLLKQLGVSSGKGTNPQSGVTPANNAASGGTLLAKAQPDACFKVNSTDPNTGVITSVTDTYPIAPVDGACPSGMVPKTDQAYVWGLTQAGHYLWFGTMANTQCLVEGSYLHTTTPSANQDAVCEFGVSGNPYAALGPAGDWRPPHIYVYDLQSNGGVNSGLTDAATIPGNGALSADLMQTLGLRSAGSVGNYVLLAGPALAGGGVNVYIFTAN